MIASAMEFYGKSSELRLIWKWGMIFSMKEPKRMIEGAKGNDRRSKSRRKDQTGFSYRRHFNPTKSVATHSVVFATKLKNTWFFWWYTHESGGIHESSVLYTNRMMYIWIAGAMTSLNTVKLSWCTCLLAKNYYAFKAKVLLN